MIVKGIPKFVPTFIISEMVTFPNAKYALAATLDAEQRELLRKYLVKGAFVIITNNATDIGVMSMINEFRTDDDGSVRIEVETFFFRIRKLEASPENALCKRWETAAEELPTKKEFFAPRFQAQIGELAGWQWITNEVMHQRDMPEQQSLETLSAFVDRMVDGLNQYITGHPFLEAELVLVFSELNVGKRLAMANALYKRFWKTRLGTWNDGDREKNIASVAKHYKETRKQDPPNQQNNVPDFMKDVDLGTFPEEVRKVIEDLLKQLDELHPSERSVAQSYLKVLIELPWTAATPDNFDLAEAKKVLDEDHYGIDHVKERIIEHLAVRRLNPKAKGMILCLGGPPGVGKTSLGKSIARAMGRKFVRMSLGGVRDEADIRGHRRTYVGAMPGRIMKAIKEAGVVNPVIMLDEVDKLGRDGFRGSPEDALLEVLDPEQNSAFEDHYVALPYDLSRVFFITTANDVSAIIPALRDRMEIIPIAGYSEEEKLVIAKRHLIPKQIEENGLEPKNLVERQYQPIEVRFSDNALTTIIREYTNEAGVRGLERKIRMMMQKIATSLSKINDAAGTAVTVKEITMEDISGYLGSSPLYKEFSDLGNLPPGVGSVLMVGSNGGSIEMLEVSWSPRDKFDVKNTGLLAQVLDESIDVSLSRLLHPSGILWGRVSTNKFIHSHLDSSAVPKDGPSAGVMHFVTLFSAFTGVPVKPFISITGEITLRRNAVYPVGGIRDKILAGEREGLREIGIPRTNLRDVENLLKTAKLDADVLISGQSWRTIEDLNAISRVTKDRLTIYAIATPEEALAIAFPKYYPELPPGFKFPEEVMAKMDGKSDEG